ncbi:hypothetical protein AVEN_185352-1 [Araneus ventricosus]|uniref:Uncharacterized protein n=1 Tax=Araneus ventricosus TaxID=182803 RepID=A0A4Y2HRR1_ARAVE|nr:hypothetical protein AVEN_185352-1 [Araneus ventricosus]
MELISMDRWILRISQNVCEYEKAKKERARQMKFALSKPVVPNIWVSDRVLQGSGTLVKSRSHHYIKKVKIPSNEEDSLTELS